MTKEEAIAHENTNVKMFWDSANGKYTSDDSYCPVYNGIEGIYVETSNSADDTNLLLDFAFSQADKDSGLVYRLREAHFKEHNFRAFRVTRMIVPPSFYSEMYERFIR